MQGIGAIPPPSLGVAARNPTLLVDISSAPRRNPFQRLSPPKCPRPLMGLGVSDHDGQCRASWSKSVGENRLADGEFSNTLTMRVWP
jgi:hypothetical protein